MQSHVLAAPDFEGYVCSFGSLHPAFELSCDIEYLYKQLLFIEQNRNFPKRRWLRSRNVFLSSARLDSLVVNRKSCFENFLRSLYLEQYVFSFKCRVTFRMRQTSKATFGTLALYILRLRCLVISNTYKNTFCFISKIEIFQNDVEYVPEMSFWALLIDSLVVNRKSCFENFLRSLYLEQYVFSFKCRVTFRLRQTSKATFAPLALYILRLSCLVISNTYTNSFCFLSKTETFQKDVEYVPEMSFWALLGLILWL